MTDTIWLPFAYEAEFRYRHDSEIYRAYVVETTPVAIQTVPAETTDLAFLIRDEAKGDRRWFVVDGVLMRELLGPDETPISIDTLAKPVDPTLMKGQHFYSSGWQDHPTFKLDRFFERKHNSDAVTPELVESGRLSFFGRNPRQFWKWNWTTRDADMADAHRIADTMRLRNSIPMRVAQEPLIALSCNVLTCELHLETSTPPILLRHSKPTIFFAIDEHEVAMAAAQLLAADRDVFEQREATITDLTVPVEITGRWSPRGETGELMLAQYVEGFLFSHRDSAIKQFQTDELIAYGAARHALAAASHGDSSQISVALETIEEAGARTWPTSGSRQLSALLRYARLARTQFYGDLPDADIDAVVPGM